MHIFMQQVFHKVFPVGVLLLLQARSNVEPTDQVQPVHKIYREF